MKRGGFLFLDAAGNLPVGSGTVMFFLFSADINMVSNKPCVEGCAMKDDRPKMKEDEMCMLLREDKIEAFTKRWAQGERCDLTGMDLRGMDLRKLNVEGVDFSNSYFRQADLRGLNMSTCNLEGASIRGAQISGTYFPKELSPEEILLSLSHGTRMRY